MAHQRGGGRGVVPGSSYRGEQPATVVYTDGACTNNGRQGARAGYGVHFPGNPSRDISAPLAAGGRATNQRAELAAIERAVHETRGAPGPVEIRTDSQYAVDGLTKWAPNWERTGRDPATVANYDMFARIREAAADRAHPVVVTHVRGHAGDTGNTTADALARRGASFY